MQGRSADFARHAIPSIRKQRILVTLVKSQPRKFIDGHRFPAPSSNWAPPPSRSPSHIRPVPAKHYGPVPPTGVLPTPQLPPPNGIQSMFVPTPVAAGMAFSAPVALPPASVWPSAPLRHPPPRLPLPGTGVFLPSQGSNNSSNQHVPTIGTENISTEKDEHSVVKSNGLSNPGKEDDEGTKQECNGGVEKETEESVSKKEDENDDAVKSGEAV